MFRSRRRFPRSLLARTLSAAGLVALLSGCADAPVDEEAGPDQATAAAASIDLERLEEAAPRARAIFVGEIIAIEQRLSQPDADGRVIPFHFATWRVERAVRGVVEGATWTGRFAGGPLPDGRSLWVSEVPELAVGQRALILAGDGDRGACPLVGCRDGLLPIAPGADLDALLRLPALASLSGKRTELVRSADPDAPFVFAMQPRASRDRLEAARDAARARRLEQAAALRDRAPDRDPAELDALRANGGDPVLR